MTDTDHDRAQRVLSALLDYIDTDSPLKGTDITVRASWIQGRFVFVVYEQTRWPGLYGFVADTDTGITEPYTADPQRLGIELAMFGVYEPVAMAPNDVVERHELFWYGDTKQIPDLPNTLDEVNRHGYAS
ncbi:hypothetical protein [Nocardia sp. NPDC056000]|uniref:hypothetical protein n=1 Tax=Nocardia sp. NPDC056000 TaxID=3345674 RepID=UPI0035D8D6BC